MADGAAAKASADQAKTAMDSAIKVARDSVAELAKLNQQRIDGLKQEYEGTLGMLQKNESETKAALPAAQASMSAA